ncbi:MAG: response regulator transcription factor [Bacteroidales bacterium]|nr:response regulator transcription factor [Bacteroidales bacterium]
MNNKRTILYVEDDETLSYITKDSLEMHGFHVLHCTNGNDALSKFNSNDISICLFDIMLPRLDGFSLAREIRKTDAEVPIIFLTARSLKEDKIEGLKLGADDYMVKPFSIEELILRINIFIKRSRINSDKTINKCITLGQYVFDRNNQLLTIDGKEIHLTQRESELLALFVSQVNQIVKKEDILKSIWYDVNSVYSRSLDVFVSRLRKMLDADPNLKIENIHGIGYRLKNNSPQ